MKWRLALSLVRLREEVNSRWPQRSKDSDGTIGDERHQAERTSDHNPWIKDPGGPNVVTALDLTHDPDGGFDSYAFAEWCRLQRDRRVKYIISNRKIMSGSAGPQPWVWRKYSGSNPHDHHVHISVKADKTEYDNGGLWHIQGAVFPNHTEPKAQPVPATIRRGMEGHVVELAQKPLGLVVDGIFGRKTEVAVQEFQLAHGLHADGIVGPQTWKALLA